MPKSEQLDSLGFRAKVANSLIKANKDTSPKRGRPSGESIENQIAVKKRIATATPLPSVDIITDTIGHWPIIGDCQRCKRQQCKGKSMVKCQKCNIHLCLKKILNAF